MKIKWSLCMPGIHGAQEDGEFEIEDDATDEKIQSAVDEEVYNYVSWGWEKVEE